MKRLYIIIIVLAGVLSLFLYNRYSVDKVLVDSSSYNLKDDMEFAYLLEYKSKISFNQEIEAKNKSIYLKAKLNIKVLKCDNDIVLMALKLQDLKLLVGSSFLEEKLSKLYSDVIFIEMTKKGQILSYHTPNQEDYSGLIGLYNLLEVSISKSSRYQVVESSLLGDVNATYHRDKFLINKSRTISKESGYRFIYSKGNIILSKDMRWIDTILFKEKIEKLENGYFLFMSTNSFTLQSTKLDKNHIKSSRNSLDSVLKKYKKQKYIQKSSLLEDAKMDNISKNIRDKSITMNKLIEDNRDNLTIGKIMDIRDYLRIYPNSIPIVVEYIHKYPESSLSSALIHSLELTDTDKAQQALIELLDQDTTLELDRERVIVAMGGLKNPNMSIIDTLVALSNRDNKEVNSALYMLGALYHSNNIDIKTSIENRFREIFDAGEDDNKYLESTIIAASQADIKEFENDIINYLDSPNSSVVVSSIKALSSSDSQDSYDKVSLLIDNNQPQKILSTAIEYLTPKDNDIEIQGKIILILQTNINRDIQNSAIKWLSKTIKVFPQNRGILKDRLHSISDKRLLKDVIRAIR